MRLEAFDTSWVIGLFGTAVGAGILFLPINAGMGGFWPIALMSLFIFPMIFLSHRSLSRFVLCAKHPDKDITHVVEEYFGSGVGKLITVLYFFAIYPICLAYGVGITNTLDSFLTYQMHLQPTNRLLLAFVLISAMMLVMSFNERIMLRFSQALTYPLIIALMGFSLYLIPYWKIDALLEIPSPKQFANVLWITLPVLIFSFNHSPAISAFSLSIRKAYKSQALEKSNQILFVTSGLLLIFVMFFVFSCILCLSPLELQAAREQNIPILSYFANKFDNPIISYVAPLIAFTAITTSFFGHYLGAREGLNGIIRKYTKQNDLNKTIKTFSALFIYITMIATAYVNPSILGFIESLGGPIIAVILFLLPVAAIYKIPSMRHFANPLADGFIVITGLIAISAILYQFTQ
ncbi:aromatic amino acid transport family protein [Helicobacter sp. 11S02596-1]|uniref:aromatic amino acid transport family protein n=1 Tax=Helicobacter sp. 11S02596-1 TaxID=1476194 RepID=UPI000BA6ECA4|nr:aromatic amino acid transport family protein [Helicobacter sp. 11S02596-1]